MNARLAAVYTLYDVIAGGRSLSSTLTHHLDKIENPADKGLCQEITYGTLRYYRSLQQTLKPFLNKSIPKKNQALEIVLCSALYQLLVMKLPDYAVINESVALVKPIDFDWASGFINAVLRNVVRQQPTLDIDTNHDHPTWLAQKIQAAFPKSAESIFTTNHQAARVMLRVRSGLREDYLTALEHQQIAAIPHVDNKEAVVLTQPTLITQLPQFDTGGVTVQDANAQLAANLIGVKSGMHVLDACAAPGGKTAHLFDKADDVTITAIDNVASRVATMRTTLKRLNVVANVITADVMNSKAWHDGQLFDRILLDAPCSATGVIRKHPDILYHRRQSDIDKLTQVQSQLLAHCWTLLKPGGRLLYATCSILPEENIEQVRAFLDCTEDAEIKPLGHNRAIKQELGTLQFLPDSDGDGFFYALFEKKIN